MKILMLSSEFYPVMSGGLGIVCYSIAKNLVNNGIEVNLLIPCDLPVYFSFKTLEDIINMDPIPITTNEEIKNEIKNIGKRFNRSNLSRVARDGYGYPELIFSDVLVKKIVKKIPFDIIHANDWSTVRTALKIKKVSNRPLISHVHSTEYERACGYGNYYIHSTESLGLQNADCVVTVSKGTGNILNKRYGIKNSKIQVIYNAHDPSLFPNMSIDKTRKYGKRGYVIYVGRLTLQKGPFYFLEIAKEMKNRYNININFIVAGDGELKSEIDMFIKREGLSENVKLVGFLSRMALASLLSRASVLLLTSVYEPFGLAALEAMSFGVVPVVTKGSGIKELINWLPSFNYYDTDLITSFLNGLLHNNKLLKKYATKSLKAARLNTWDRRIKEFIRVYKKLIR